MMIKLIIFMVTFIPACTIPAPLWGCESEDYEPVIDTYADDHNCYFTLESCDE